MLPGVRTSAGRTRTSVALHTTCPDPGAAMRTDYHPRFPRVALMAGNTARTGPLCVTATVHCLASRRPAKTSPPVQAQLYPMIGQKGQVPGNSCRIRQAHHGALPNRQTVVASRSHLEGLLRGVADAARDPSPVPSRAAGLRVAGLWIAGLESPTPPPVAGRRRAPRCTFRVRGQRVKLLRRPGVTPPAE
jgi:hypothetical protein